MYKTHTSSSIHQSYMTQYYLTSAADKIRSDRRNDLMEATREVCFRVTIKVEEPRDNQSRPDVCCILPTLEKASSITSFCHLKMLGDGSNGLSLGLSTPLNTFLKTAK